MVGTRETQENTAPGFKPSNILSHRQTWRALLITTAKCDHSQARNGDPNTAAGRILREHQYSAQLAGQQGAILLTNVLEHLWCIAWCRRERVHTTVD